MQEYGVDPCDHSIANIVAEFPYYTINSEDRTPAQDHFIKALCIVCFPLIHGALIALFHAGIEVDSLPSDFQDPILPRTYSGSRSRCTNFTLASKYECAADQFSIFATQISEAAKVRLATLFATDPLFSRYTGADFSAYSDVGWCSSVLYPFESSASDNSMWISGATYYYYHLPLFIRRLMEKLGSLIFTVQEAERRLRRRIKRDTRPRLNSSVMIGGDGNPYDPNDPPLGDDDGSDEEYVRAHRQRATRPIMVLPEKHFCYLLKHGQLPEYLGEARNELISDRLLTMIAPEWDMTQYRTRVPTTSFYTPSAAIHPATKIPLPDSEWNEFQGDPGRPDHGEGVLLSLSHQALPMMCAMWWIFEMIHADMLVPAQYEMDDGSPPVDLEALTNRIWNSYAPLDHWIYAAKERVFAKLWTLRDENGDQLVVNPGRLNATAVKFPHEQWRNSRSEGIPESWLDIPPVKNALCLLGSLFYWYRAAVNDMVASIESAQRSRASVRHTDPSIAGRHRLENSCSVSEVMGRWNAVGVPERMKKRTWDIFMFTSASRFDPDDVTADGFQMSAWAPHW